ncbi:MAG: TlpA family protein disulfide reductase [Spirochaetales bacterium]|nr:TlpA family protein disulfide reductase [Spirochaetales bacterium]
MNRQTRNLMIAIIAFLLVIILAAVLYEKLVDKAVPTVSYAPVLRDLPQNESTVTAKASVDEAPTAGTEEEELPRSEGAMGVTTPVDEESPDVTEEAESDDIMMPNIPFFRLDGTETDFYEVAGGKPVVLNYFASWCPPCQAEMPDFVKAYNAHKDEVTFIFLDSLDGERESLATLKTFIGKQKMDEDSVFYDEGIFAYIFQTTSLPTTVFFYADGAIAGGQLGMVSAQLLDLAIEEITGEASRRNR